MLKAVIFDLDGTLLYTIKDITAALNRALAACGLPTHSVEAVQGFVGNGIRDAVRRAVPEGTAEEVQEKVLDLYKEDYREHCAESTVCYPGVRELAAGLDRAGIAQAVLSNKTEATARKVVASFFPDGPFAHVFGRVGDRPLKPDPAAAVPVLEALGCSPSEAAYVGDSGTDMVFARAVGMLPAAAPWGYRSREELAASGAVLMPDGPEDLLKLLLEGNHTW
ncbi:MAG: HAD family hydrolase [Oscillospiraceae bacterium]|jgi:phosphoglycolate phosphatase|nr:HAD family hydrolase [Oscillospiraceae bacterium]